MMGKPDLYPTYSGIEIVRSTFAKKNTAYLVYPDPLRPHKSVMVIWNEKKIWKRGWLLRKGIYARMMEKINTITNAKP